MRNLALLLFGVVLAAINLVAQGKPVLVVQAFTVAPGVELPYDMKGSVTPVDGTSDRFTAICNSAWIALMFVMPIASRKPNRSGALRATR